MASAAGDLPADADLDRSASSRSTNPSNADDLRRGGRHGHRHGHDTLQRRPRAEPAVGRRLASRRRSTTTGRRPPARPRSSTRVYNTELVGARTRSRCCATSRSTTRGSSSVVTKLNQDISEIQLQATITNTVSNVRNAYWDYVFAMQAVEVARQSLALADKLVQGQPDARRGRHDGADRRRPGAVAGGHAAPEPGDGRGHAAHRRAGAQAADRRRHGGSELERDARPGRSAGVRAAAGRRRRRPSGGRSTQRTDLAAGAQEPRRSTTSR